MLFVVLYILKELFGYYLDWRKKDCDEKSRDGNLGWWNITSMPKARWQTLDGWWWWEVMCEMSGFYFGACLFFCKLWTCECLRSMALEFFFGACCGCHVWSKVALRIFCLDVNEDEMVVELKKQGRQAFCAMKCFWTFNLYCGICIWSLWSIGLVLKGWMHYRSLR
jgi:hypothetical protein